MKRKLFALFLALAASAVTIFAEVVKIDDLYYDYTVKSTFILPAATIRYDTIFYVTSCPEDEKYSGDIVIPASIEYNGKKRSVTIIGEKAFYGCADLTSIEISDGITDIGVGAFHFCTGLTSVTIPQSVTYIAVGAFVSAFEGCSSLPIENNLRYADTYLVEAVDKTLSSYTIKEGTRWIGNVAFRDCISLTSIEIPNSVTIIGGDAFNGCTGLTSVEIPNSVTIIGGGAFSGCTSLTSIKIPYGVTSIGDGAFGYCASLTSIEIPNSVKSIGMNAFCVCYSLTSISLPYGIEKIENWTFAGCTSLSSVTIPNSVTDIGDEAFHNCTGLTSIEIPNRVTSIGSRTFMGCNSLTSIKVEEGNGVYDSRNNCNAIIYTSSNALIVGCQNTIIPNSITSIGGEAFYGCTGLTSIEIPNSVTTVGNYAFQGCSNLTSVEIPNSVINIGFSAFRDCSSLTSIEIPKSVTSIGQDAFEYCTGLTSVTCYAITPPELGTRVWEYVDCSKIPLYVPANSIDLYKNADQWKDFNPIQSISSQSIEDIHIDAPQSTKILLDGQIYILRGGHAYDAAGKMVR